MDLNFTKHKGLFVTATDTGVGKTLVAGAIANILAQTDQRIGVFKPVATGCRLEREGLVNEDAEFLSFCADSRLSLSDINPITYSIPAAPFACEVAENKKVEVEKIVTSYNYICSQTDIVIVEGIGGIAVPITEGLNVLGLAKAMDLPVVIVARPDLGTINHTLLTIDAVRSANLPLAGVVITGYDESVADYAQQSGPAVIAQTGQTQILSVVPFDYQTDTSKGIIGNIVLDYFGEVDWQKIIERR